jgi:hypothetical protein
MNKIKQVLRPKANPSNEKNVGFSKDTKGIKYPPKNNIATNVDIKIIEAYSAKKNITKGTEECSVKNPATSSDSASGKSKGALLVSAITEIKNIKESGNNGIIYQTLIWA